jgi:hypothetical protein
LALSFLLVQLAAVLRVHHATALLPALLRLVGESVSLRMAHNSPAVEMQAAQIRAAGNKSLRLT